MKSIRLTVRWEFCIVAMPYFQAAFNLEILHPETFIADRQQISLNISTNEVSIKKMIILTNIKIARVGSNLLGK